MTQLDRWRRDFGATQQRRGHLLGLFSPTVYRAGNLSENLSVGLDQKFGQANYSAGGGAAMQQIADWLKTLGMSEYAERFAENAIDFSVLPDLTDQDLEKLGVLLGHRRKLLRAIADLKDIKKSEPEVAVAAAIPAAPRPQDAAERRQVAVMFSDLVGSTALSARMDPEDLREVISAYQKCVAETVRRWGGFVAKFMGDGVLNRPGFAGDPNS